MKKYWSILVLIGMLALALRVPAWAEDLKVAVVEPQKVLEGTKAGKKIKDSLADYVKTRQRLLDSEAEDLKKMEEDLAKQGATLSPAAKQERETVLRQKAVAYQRRVQDLEVEVQAKKTEVLSGFTKTIEQVVKEIAEKEKIFLVIDKGNTGADTLVIFNNPSVDMTDRVIKEVDSRKGN